MKESSGNKKTLFACLIAAATIPFTLIALGDWEVTADGHAWVGSGHTVNSGSHSLAVGMNNVVSANRSVAIGYGIYIGSDDVTAVGKWNADKAGILFAVGNGTAPVRNNALEVYDDGRIVIDEVQGDISMGIYGGN